MHNILLFIEKFDLSYSSLMYFYAIPFVYFFFHFSNWNNADRLKVFDSVFYVVVVLLAAALGYRWYIDSHKLIIPRNQIYILHFAPLVLSFLMASHEKMLRGSDGLQNLGNQVTALKKKSLAKAKEEAPLESRVVNWDDVALGENLAKEVRQVISSLRDPDQASSFGIELPKGIVVLGPRGSGKSTVARLIMCESGLSTFELNVSNLINPKPGFTIEETVLGFFDQVLKQQPSILFMDELESMTALLTNKDPAMQIVFSKLIELIDESVSNHKVFIIGTTSRPNLVDGRLQKVAQLKRFLTLEPPAAPERKKLFEIYLRGFETSGRIDYSALAEQTAGATAPVIKDICNRAAMLALQRAGEEGGDRAIGAYDIEKVISQLGGSKA